MDRSFNRVTVDGDESTSDTVAVLANGLAENAPLERSGRGLRAVPRRRSEAVAEKLAQMLVQDGEGATKLVRGARVGGAHAPGGADRRAQRGQLAPGQDRHLRRRPQLGAHHDGAGQVAAKVAPDRVAIQIGDERVVERGMLRPGARMDRVEATMRGGEYTHRASSSDWARGEDSVWTSDLTEEYVRLNSKYTT